MTVRFGPMLLQPSDVAPAVLTKGPLVDEFGQWMLETWPGKPASLRELETQWRAEEKTLERLPDFQWTRYGGWKASRREKPSGFFRSVKRDGRWWLVDPEGALFWSLGMDCIRPGEATPVKGREFLYRWLPPVERDRRGSASADFYLANIQRRFADSWQERWKAAQEMRLASWGFNTIGNWSHPMMFAPARLPYVASAEPRWNGKSWVGFPDVHAAEYQAAVDAAVRGQVTALAKDPFLIGWFIGNEPRWHDRNLVERILTDPEDSATRVSPVSSWEARATRHRLARRYWNRWPAPTTVPPTRPFANGIQTTWCSESAMPGPCLNPYSAPTMSSICSASTSTGWNLDFRCSTALRECWTSRS